MMRYFLLVALAVSFAFVVSCSSSKKAVKDEDAKYKDYEVTSSGLMYKDTEVGYGATPKEGQTVVVHYTGTFEDGSVFDSSVPRGKPFEFRIGVGQVIKGWDEGVMTMKVGGKRKLVVPPKLGYGSQQRGSIPPNSVLLFDVELIDLK